MVFLSTCYSQSEGLTIGRVVCATKGASMTEKMVADIERVLGEWTPTHIRNRLYETETYSERQALGAEIEQLVAYGNTLLTERAALVKVAEAAREWTRIEHDPEEVLMDEAIEICDRLQAATEKWMSDQQAALSAVGE